MYYIYILQSKKNKSIYIGFTENPKQRLKEHNRGKIPSSRKHLPYQLIYLEGYLEKKDALSREKFLKGGSGYKYLKKQLKNYFSCPPSSAVEQLHGKE